MTDFDRFAEPIDGDLPCGPDCEYDNDFLALSQAVVGKPEQQFGDTIIPAVDPDWRQVDSMSNELLERTRDLRVVAWLTLANTHIHGTSSFAAGLRLALTLCEHFWDSVHPRIEVDGDTDPYLRMNALAAFSGSEFSGEDKLIQALRASTLIKQPLAVTYRDIELAFAKAPEAPYALSQIESLLSDALISGNSDVTAVVDAYKSYVSLRELLDEKVSIEERPDLERLESVLKPVAQGIQHLQNAGTADGESGSEAGSSETGLGGRGPGGSGAVQSREDARRALDRVCEYLERHEPSNPAALFARRAQRLLDMPFMDLMRELSPDSMSHLEMLTGVKPPQDDE